MEPFVAWTVGVLATVYGLCVGSFLNVVICRLPIGKKMTNERSECPKCHSLIHWYDNIPLISYLVLRGKCRSCKEPISFRYPLVEALNMVLWLCSYLLYLDNLPYALITALTVSVSLCIFFIDIDTHLIFDRFQVMLAVLGVAAVFFDEGTAWYSHLIGAVLGGALFWLVGLAVSKKVGKDALGFGDVKLVAAMGLILGWEKLVLCMLLTSVIALAVMGITRKVKNLGKDHEFAFGPFLVTGLVVSMLVGNDLITWYMHLLG